MNKEKNKKKILLVFLLLGLLAVVMYYVVGMYRDHSYVDGDFKGWTKQECNDELCPSGIDCGISPLWGDCMMAVEANSQQVR